MPILRNRKTCMKWCVKRTELRGQSRFPQYCAGIGYVVSSPVIRLLYNASKSTPFFWIDDVYVTGLLAKKLPVAVNYVNTQRHFALKADVALEQYANVSDPVKYYLVHSKDPEKFVELWRTALRRLSVEQKRTVNEKAIAGWS